MLGTAFGIRTLAENVGLFVTPMFIGEVLDRTSINGRKEYIYALAVLLAIALLGFALGSWIYMDDMAHRGGVLDQPG